MPSSEAAPVGFGGGDGYMDENDDGFVGPGWGDEAFEDALAVAGIDPGRLAMLLALGLDFDLNDVALDASVDSDDEALTEALASFAATAPPPRSAAAGAPEPPADAGAAQVAAEELATIKEQALQQNAQHFDSGDLHACVTQHVIVDQEGPRPDQLHSLRVQLQRMGVRALHDGLGGASG